MQEQAYVAIISYMTTFIGLSSWDEIGSPRGAKPVSAQALHREVVQRTGKKHPKVLYIPTAKDDRADYIKFFKDYYLELGCKEVETLCLLGTPPPSSDIRAKILSADAIYINGGNTHRAIATWKRLGVDKLLKQAYQSGTVMAGHSAGTVCWFTYGCSDSFYKSKPFRLTGMGVFHAVVCPHYDTEIVRHSALKSIMKRTPGFVGIALDEDVAIEIVDGKYRILTVTPSAKARRAYWQGDTYILEDIPASQSFRSLDTLLTKP